MKYIFLLATALILIGTSSAEEYQNMNPHQNIPTPEFHTNPSGKTISVAAYYYNKNQEGHVGLVVDWIPVHQAEYYMVQEFRENKLGGALVETQIYKSTSEKRGSFQHRGNTKKGSGAHHNADFPNTCYYRKTVITAYNINDNPLAQGFAELCGTGFNDEKVAVRTSSKKRTSERVKRKTIPMNALQRKIQYTLNIRR